MLIQQSTAMASLTLIVIFTLAFLMCQIELNCVVMCETSTSTQGATIVEVHYH